MKNRMLRLLVACIALQPPAATAGAFYLSPTLEFDSYAKNDARFQGIFPQLGAGYGEIFANCIYLGGEIFGGPKTIKWSNTRRNGTDLKTTYSYGVSLLPGYVFDNVVMGYLRFGVRDTNFDSLDTAKRGYVLGLGLEGMLDAHWSVRGEYDATKYAAINGVGHVTAGTYALGVKYTFL